MNRPLLAATCLVLALGGVACTQGEAGTATTAAGKAVTSPPGDGYRKVSELTKLPDFIPNLGTLYVQPRTLPAGPFLAYDRSGRLVSTIYMVPLDDLEAQKKFSDLAVGDDPTVRSVDLYYNAGHPGVEKPHYHIVLWHVPKDTAQLQ
ncbi:hypothetical protein [Benzoatithermus flavus]|uniref:Lipoprotein n=1 Tax=Benzoatithermus flavus TaxID=3108223 RepID=A0ABU8XZ90_9PROT